MPAVQFFQERLEVVGAVKGGGDDGGVDDAVELAQAVPVDTRDDVGDDEHRRPDRLAYG